MGSLWQPVNRWLTCFHRWSGVVLCLIVVAWFASGVVLLYVPFPALREADRLAVSEPIDASRVVREPADALAQAPGTEQLLLISVAHHPTYLAVAANGLFRAIPADAETAQMRMSVQTAQTVAEGFGRAPATRVDGPLDYDQWIVHQHFDPYRPFYRVRLNDAERTDLYVSSRTGQVLQRTRSSERAWNWCGAVLHWIYFTPLRKSWSAWNQVVWWLSLVTLLASCVGTWLGIDRYLKTRAAGRSAWSPFRGWMRWHHVIGLFASAIVLVFIFSGWLSMDHGRLFSKGDAAQQQALRFQGMPLDSIARAIPAGFLQHVGPASEIRFGGVGGHPLIAARGGHLKEPRVFWLDRPGTDPTGVIDISILVAGLRGTWSPERAVEPAPHPKPDFYGVAESLAETAVPFSVSASEPLRVYVDSVTGQLLVVMDRSRRAYAWLYYALHTFNFPVLLTHSALRSVVVTVLMVIGLIFSGTGVVLGYQRLRRSLAH